MKNFVQFNRTVILFALFLNLIIGSCTKEVPPVAPESVSSENLQLKVGTIAPNYAMDDIACDLIAGQSIPVGQVLYSHDADNLYVTYITTNGWMLSEVHFYAGNLDNFTSTCTNKKAIQVGHFLKSATNLNVTTKSFTIPLSSISKDENGYMVVAHAVVKKGGQQETAFANCTYKPIIAVKSHFTEVDASGNNKWACSNGVPYPNNTWYCPYLGTNVYENGEEYLLQSWLFPALDGAGKVNVTDDGFNLVVVVTPNEGLTLKDTYLYLGSMKGLIVLGEGTGGCPNYSSFPYQNFDATPTHNFSIPISMHSSISFESAFGSGRWGWFSYYNF